MCSVIKDEFVLQKFGLNHDQPHLFIRPQWKIPRIIFLLYRFVMAGYTIFGLVYGIYQNESSPFDFHISIVYMTFWTYILLTFHFIINFIAACFLDSNPNSSSNKVELTNVVSSNGYHNHSLTSDSMVNVNGSDVHLSKESANNVTHATNQISNEVQDESRQFMPWYLKIIWIIANINSVFAIVVTGVYFGALYTPGLGVSLNDWNIHALNTVFIVVDNFISARPVRLLHFIHPLIYAVIYMIFSVIYWAADNTNVIYHGVLDWNIAGRTVGFCFAILAVIILLQVVTFALFRLKVLIHSKCSSS